MKSSIIWTQGSYRIVEFQDMYVDLDDLKGDCFDPETNSDIDPVQLLKKEREFEAHAVAVGVYGYELERWNPAIGIGWEHIDSCHGFIGRYSELDDEYNHYIVEEMKHAIAGRVG